VPYSVRTQIQDVKGAAWGWYAGNKNEASQTRKHTAAVRKLRMSCDLESRVLDALTPVFERRQHRQLIICVQSPDESQVRVQEREIEQRRHSPTTPL
jgi:hypothetical protein